MKRRMIRLAAVALALALAAAAGGVGAEDRPSLVIGGDGARVLCASNQITQVVEVTAYAVDIVCAPGPSVGQHYTTLVAPSRARVACGKAGAPMNRGVLRERRIRADVMDLDCR